MWSQNAVKFVTKACEAALAAALSAKGELYNTC